MKKSLLPAFFIAVCILTTAVLQAQGLKTLETNNGFKTYKLGSRYNSVYGLKNRDEDGAEKVVINYTKDMIGDIPVRLIDLYYLNDTLAKIIVHVSPEYHAKLIEAVKNSFGPPATNLSDNEETRKKKNDLSNKGNSYTDQYKWNTKRFNMEYYYTYPQVSGGAYGLKDLHLAYTLNDYPARQQKVKKGSYSGKDF